MNSHPIQYKYGTATNGFQPVGRVKVDGLFRFEVWRQRRDDLLREAEQARMVQAARGGNQHPFFGGLLHGLSGMFARQERAENEYRVVSKPEIRRKVRRIPGRDRRCGNRAA